MILDISTFWGFLPFRTQSEKSSWWLLLPWISPPEQSTNPSQWSIVASILKFVVASAAEAEPGDLFVNCKEGIICLVLEELGHPQPPTPVHCNNATAVGIANDTVKKHRARFLDYRSSRLKVFCGTLAPRPRKFSRLFYQAFQCQASSRSTPLVHTYA